MLLRPVLLITSSLLLTGAAHAADVAPDFEGLREAVHDLVDGQRLAGAVMLASQNGERVFSDVYGQRRLEEPEPATDDTIFLLASMTKPVVGVAMMILFEEGKWKLDDSVATYIPEFADLQVTADSGPARQSHPMTMRELMSHSAGFDVNQAKPYEAVNLRDRTLPMQTMVDKLADLPLAFQPGTDWRYGPSADVQAYLIEKLSGQPFEAFLQDRIFAPLGMNSTGFWPVAGEEPGRLSPAKLDRVSGVFSAGADGRVIALPDFSDASARPPFPSGGGGLMSTAHDYERFARMLLNEGELDGARILQASTVALMHQNVLPPGVTVTASPGVGFGLDLAVVQDADADVTSLPEGAYYWAGGSGTFFWVDPSNDLVFVGMVHAVGRNVPDVRSLAIGKMYPDVPARE
jgi:CubicO group peptidase (beta-lactamase class C family)